MDLRSDRSDHRSVTMDLRSDRSDHRSDRLISSTLMDSCLMRCRVSVRGVANLPLVKSPQHPASFCSAFALVSLGDQQYRTAVMNNTVNAFWEQEFEMEVLADDDHLHVEVIHCDRVTADQFLGSVRVALTDLFNPDEPASSQPPIERSFPVLTRKLDALRGDDGAPTILTLGLALLDPEGDWSSESEDESSVRLPQSTIKLTKQQETEQSSHDSLPRFPGWELPSADRGDRGAVSSVPPRGGVGLKFKVRS